MNDAGPLTTNGQYLLRRSRLPSVNPRRLAMPDRGRMVSIRSVWGSLVAPLPALVPFA